MFVNFITESKLLFKYTVVKHLSMVLSSCAFAPFSLLPLSARAKSFFQTRYSNIWLAGTLIAEKKDLA